jgi:Xaa-Pro aminopeptidase
VTKEKLMNVEEFQRQLDQSGFDVVVATSLHNVLYTSGAFIQTQVSIPDRLALTVLPKKGENALLVCNIEESLARDQSWIKDVRSYVEFAQSPVSLLVEVLKEKGFASGRIGIEKRHLTTMYFEELAEALPKAKIGAADKVFEYTRSIKTPGEIERYREAGLATERAILEAFQEAKIGDTERAVLAAIKDKVALYGAIDIDFGILAAGDHSYQAHPSARERPLEPGDMVRVDFGAVWNGGYGSDIARMAVVGGANDAQKDTYSKVWQVQRKAVEFMRPGVRGCDVFECCRQAYANFGIEYFGPHAGHGFGFAGHEVPMLQPFNKEELRPNMLICIEPVILFKDLGGFQVEDLILITEDGSEILTNYADTEELFVIR